MADALFLTGVLYLILGNLVHSDVIVNINYGDQDGVSTCVSKVETTSCCKHRGLLVSGNIHSIPNAQIKASTEWGPQHESYHARIFNTVAAGAWVPKLNLPDPWIQFDLGTPMTILAVVTRGRADVNQFVQSYKVKYSTTPQQHAAGNWKMASYKPAPEIAPADQTIFPGNHDRDTYQVNYLDEAIRAQYVRIYPLTANQIHIALRADLIGCLEN